MPSRLARFITNLLRGSDERNSEHIPQRLPYDPTLPSIPGTEPVPTDGFEYDPELVPRLKRDHVILVKQFGELGGYIRRDESALRFVREVVQPSFASHLILENYFYATLEAHAERLDLGDDPDVWRQFRGSMKDIARAVNRFLSEIVAGRLNDTNKIDYLKRYQEIMDVLGKRISDEEERLYVIYDRQLGRRPAERSKPTLAVVNS